MILLLTLAAFAGPLTHRVLTESSAGFYAGPELAIRGPDKVRAGVRLGYQVQPFRFLAFELGGGFYPHFDDGRIVRYAGPVYDPSDYSRVTWRAQAMAVWVPVHRPLSSESSAALRVGLGGGAVRTVDELGLDDDGIPLAEEVERQIHPQVVGGIAGEVRWRSLAMRWRLEGQGWNEQIGGPQDTMWMGALWSGIDLVVAWGPGVRPPPS